MVKVHIWLSDAAHVGHTALTIGEVYVSFWPAGAAGKKDVKIKTTHPGTFVSALHNDIRNEGDRQPVTIELHQLDEAKILDHVAQLVENTPRYQLARHNCSHVVAGCLMAGAAIKPSFTPNAGQYGALGRLAFGIWTPDQVLRFAMELQRHEGR